MTKGAVHVDPYISLLRSHHEETRELPGERDNAKNNVQVHVGEEDHARPGLTSRRGQDSP